jgi:hypothetical protein
MSLHKPKHPTDQLALHLQDRRPMVVSDGAPAIPSNTNSQGTSNGDTVDDGAEEVPSDEEGELENGDFGRTRRRRRMIIILCNMIID